MHRIVVFLSLIMSDVCRPALTMCMTTAWLSKNGSGMLTGSQAVAEADGNALHTCVKNPCVLLVVSGCTPAVHQKLHALHIWCCMVLSARLITVLQCK